MADFQLTDVDTRELDAVASSIEGDVEEMDRIMQQLVKNTMAGISPFWQDQAKIVFEQQFADWLADVQELVKQYRGLSDNLRETVNEYSKAEDAAKGIIAKLPR